MEKIRIITVLCILALAAFALSGCTTFNNFKEAFIDDPEDQSQIISIGVYEPMSGADKDSAKAELAGIELAHEVMPEANGFTGTSIPPKGICNTPFSELPYDIQIRSARRR